MDAEAAGELADALYGLLAPLADDVGGAELPGERDPVFVEAHDDLLGPEALGGDHPAKAHGAVPDDGRALARVNPGDHRRVVAGAHHVRERQQGRHQRVVLADRQLEERPVGVWDAHRLGLHPVVARVAESPVRFAVRSHEGGIGAARLCPAISLRHHGEVCALGVGGAPGK